MREEEEEGEAGGGTAGRPPLHSQGRAQAGAQLCHLEEGRKARREEGRKEGRCFSKPSDRKPLQ